MTASIFQEACVAKGPTGCRFRPSCRPEPPVQPSEPGAFLRHQVPTRPV